MSGGALNDITCIQRTDLLRWQCAASSGSIKILSDVNCHKLTLISSVTYAFDVPLLAGRAFNEEFCIISGVVSSVGLYLVFQEGPHSM